MMHTLSIWNVHCLPFVNEKNSRMVVVMLDYNSDRPAPKNEDEMMTEIFLYIDRLMSVVRPRRLLYMAIDGVVRIFHYLLFCLLGLGRARRSR